LTPPTGPYAPAVPLVRRGPAGLALALPTAVGALLAGLALASLASPPTDLTDLFWIALAAVPAGVALALWHPRLAPAPRLVLQRDALVVVDPFTLVEPLRIPWDHVVSVRAGGAVDAALAATVDSALGLPLPRSAEFGLDVAPAPPNLLLEFDPPVVPAGTRRVLVGRGTRTVPPDRRYPIRRLWLAASDPAAACAAFVAAGCPCTPGD
jgi:hypothetical protein